MNSAGLLLVGHGTRSRVGTGQFLELAKHVTAQLAPAAVQPAFLELAEPGIGQGIERLAAAGVRHVVVAPLLLFAAGHAKSDIPAAIDAALQRRGLTATQTEPLACEPALLELSHRRFVAVTSQPTPEDCLLLVGRGSRDGAGTAAMHEFARLRQRREGGMATEVAFLAMAWPTLAEVLPRIAATDYRRVIVQPHLLFEGELSASLARQIGEMAAQHSRTQWVLTPLLADVAGEVGTGTEVLGEVICQRFWRTGGGGEGQGR